MLFTPACDFKNIGQPFLLLVPVLVHVWSGISYGWALEISKHPAFATELFASELFAPACTSLIVARCTSLIAMSIHQFLSMSIMWIGVVAAICVLQGQVAEGCDSDSDSHGDDVNLVAGILLLASAGIQVSRVLHRVARMDGRANGCRKERKQEDDKRSYAGRKTVTMASRGSV